MKGADILIECLKEQGVDTVFGYPGGYVLEIYDALYLNKDSIKHYITSHEQGACHAADGYARVSGKTGVVFATSGPGATNLVTGIATAYMDSIPLIAITGNVLSSNLGRDSFQEIDITGVTMPITKHNYIVKDIEELAPTIREAFKIANSNRKGPVLIDILKNVAISEAEYVKVEREEIKELDIDEKSLEDVINLLKSSKKPFIIAGGGATSSEATNELAEFAEILDSPIGATLMGISSIDNYSKRFTGMIGMHGSIASNKAIKECDTIIAIGARFSDRVAQNRETFAKGKKVIHIDIDNAEINKNINADAYILGDAKKVLLKLISKLDKQEHKAWLETVYSYKLITKKHEDEEENFAKKIIASLAKLTTPETVICTDVGQHQIWTSQNYPFNSPRTLVTSGGLGTMGFGLGAAIGSCLASKKQTFLITGDGSFHMNLNEFATCVKHNLQVVVLVMNNNVLGMVRQWQKLFYDSRFSETTLERKTSYPLLAEAFGGIGYTIENEDMIEEILNKAIGEKRPVIIDCKISRDINVLPMIPPGKSYDDIILNMEEN